MNKNAFFSLTYGLYLIGVENGEKKNGCIVNTALQLTDETPRVMVSLEKNHLTTTLIRQKKSFTISVLDSSTTDDLIANFGFVSGISKDKFENIDYLVDEKNNPYIKESVAYFSCELEKEILVDTHVIFIAKVLNCDLLEQKPPLTYAQYQTRKTKSEDKTSENSTNEKDVIESKATSKKGFRCTVCNFIYDGEMLPDGFICPICHRDASVFVPIE